MRIGELLRDLGPMVAYHPALAPVCGGVTATLLLCQLLYWDRGEGDGWIMRSAKQINVATGLSQREQETARARLTERGIVIEKLAGNPATLHFRIDHDRLHALWEGRRETSFDKTSKLGSRNVETSFDETSKLLESESQTGTKQVKSTRAAQPPRETDPPDAVADATAVVPFQAIIDAYAEWGQLTVEALPKPAQGRIVGLARTLAKQGWSAEQVVACLTYLRSQKWRDAPVDLSTVASDAGTQWLAAGEPAVDHGRSTHRPARLVPGTPEHAAFHRDDQPTPEPPSTMDWRTAAIGQRAHRYAFEAPPELHRHGTRVRPYNRPDFPLFEYDDTTRTWLRVE